MFKGIETVVYYVQDLKEATQWYRKVLGIDPNSETEYYVGFTVGGHELGLHPTEGNAREPGSNGQTVYWSVANAQEALDYLVSQGGKASHEITDVGGGVKFGSVMDPFGNEFGFIENPNSPNR